MAVSWQVVSQRQTSTFANGVFEDAMAVTARTGDGVVFTVTIPLAQYNEMTAHAALSARAEQIAAVHSLSSSSSPSSSSGSAEQG